MGRRYTRGGHIPGGDIHTEEIYTWRRHMHRGKHKVEIHTEGNTRAGTQTWKRHTYRRGIYVEGHTHKGTQKGG